jgi:sulfite reductase beta subunit-like hemoprotein
MFDRLHALVAEKQYDPIQDKVLINITGCPNSCAQYYIADIGLRGLRIREKTGSVEGYQIRIGGDQDRIGDVVGDFKINDCVTVVKCILDTFMKRCREKDYDSLAAHVREEGPALYQQEIEKL